MMSMIRPHRTIYCAAIIILLLSFVLLSFQRVGYALSYWDAIFEIGFNPETQAIDATTACKQISRLIRFRNAVHEQPVFDENLNNKIREVESRISSLDAGTLYHQLPYVDSNGVWHGDHPPTKFFKGSDLDDQSLKVLFGLARDFPHFFAIFNRYFTIENVVSGESNGSTGPKTFDIVIRININAIKKEHPHIGKLIDRLKGMLNFKAAVFDTLNQPVITIGFDGDKYLFSLRFKTQGDRLLVLDKNQGFIPKLVST